ncbi:hypothetical protein BDN71DRAFT_1367267, partial [Pleurotus eryngii]
AILDNFGLTASQLDALRNPQPVAQEDFDKNLQFSLDIFLAKITSAQAAYTRNCAAIERNMNDVKMLSADQLKCQLEHISGVYAIKHDMCTNGYIAY